MLIRLDKLVAERFGMSRSAAQEAVRTGRVDLGGVRCDEPGRMVPVESPVLFDANRAKARRVVGKSAVRVLHEDAHVVIVDKPAGLATLPSADFERDSLRHRVERYLAIRHGGRPHVGIIHRLDADTSGALAFARGPESLRAFQALFRAHDVERRYLAVVEGGPARSEGTIDRALVTETGHVRRRLARSSDEGRPAVTRFQVLERFGGVASLLACWLETGRTHQVRLHLAGIGLPVLGDRVYRPATQPRCKARFHRQALHAQVLGFVHPMTHESIRVEAPLPSDMNALVNDLRNRYGLPNAGG